MARMFPDDIGLPQAGNDGPTEGEYRLYNALRDLLLPDSEFRSWYEMAIGTARARRWPDFVVFGRRSGFFVIEVKDWRADQIIRFTKANVIVGGRQSKNPERQAKGYGDRLRQELHRHGIFPDTGDIPVGLIVALPFISRAEFRGREFDRVIPEEATLLADDLDPAADAFVGANEGAFARRLAAVLPFACPRLSDEDVEKIEHLLWPNRVHIPARAGEGREKFQREVQYLDAHQASVARRLQRGHQLLKGPPGSGKTLVLVHRCKFLSLFDPGVTRILFLCFNIALASHLKRLVTEQGLGTGKNGVQVHHFFELCGRILGERVADRYEPSEGAHAYYSDVVERAAAAIPQGTARIEPFDAILVDEGQDFDDAKFRVVRSLLREGGDLVVALDSEQNLYHVKRKLKGTWKSLGIDVQGHVTPIRHVYRSTRELRRFAETFLGAKPDGDDLDPDPRQGLLPFARSARAGDPPELVLLPDRDALSEETIAQVRRYIERDGYARAEIAVLYDDKSYGTDANPAGFAYGGEAIGEELKEAFDGAGIAVQWVSESTTAKQYFDITRDCVTLASVHSAKGLDFDLVVFVYPGWPESSRKVWRLRLGPAYVAITRAKHRLVVLCAKEDPVIERMRETSAITVRRGKRG